MSTLTPIEQWERIKKEYPDEIILFRVGDFYEAYGDDADKCHAILGTAITTRHKGDETLAMTGFPHQVVDAKLAKLIQAGNRVAMVDDSLPKFKRKSTKVN